MRKAFDEIDLDKKGFLRREDVIGYVGDFLGFGFAEAKLFFERNQCADNGGSVTFEGFQKGYASLNPFNISGREGEVIFRKNGALGGAPGQDKFTTQQLQLADLNNCEVYSCTKTAQFFMDSCKGCKVLIAPCESSVFIRDCEDCTIWVATQQLRTRNCKRCTIFLYSKTAPIIEASEDLSFAPWCASYPGCGEHFTQANFDPQKNLWNAIFDFTGKDGEKHWRIVPMPEIEALTVELDGEGAKADNPVPQPTHDLLCSKALASEKEEGGSVANIPQTSPDLPAAPEGPVVIKTRAVRDSEA